MRLAAMIAGILGVVLALPAGAGAGEAGTHKLLLVEMDRGALRVIRVDEVAQALPKRRGPEKPLPWRVRIEAADGRVIHSARMEDPTIVRGEFEAADGSGRIEAVRVKRTGKVTFSIRVPAAGADRVVIQRLKDTSPRQSVQPESAWELVGLIDLARSGAGR